MIQSLCAFAFPLSCLPLGGMTFEEFFLKKKIDLKPLAKEEPELFAEFWLHFAEMGEKSFDHTKKYLFNKLRHRYPLQEADIPVSTKTAPAAPSPSALSGGTGNTGPAPSPEKSGASTQETPQKPAGFKPRFAAARKKTAAPAQPEAGDNQAATDQAPAESDQQTAFDQSQSEKPAKPAYQPRFKPGMTKPKQAASRSPETTEDGKISNADTGKKERLQTEPKQESPPEKKETPLEEKPKTPYKPRFRPGITRKKEQ